MANLHCRACGVGIDLQAALRNAPFSWPQLQCVWHPCGECRIGNHLRFSRGWAERIEIVGAPGPEWETRERVPADVAVRIDTGFLHVWLAGAHYEVAAR